MFIFDRFGDPSDHARSSRVYGQEARFAPVCNQSCHRRDGAAFGVKTVKRE
jgi:hypothetical protein